MVGVGKEYWFMVERSCLVFINCTQSRLGIMWHQKFEDCPAKNMSWIFEVES